MTDDPIHADREVDARGHNCPMPILYAKKALGDLTSGQVLKVLSTDPGADRDFQAFAKQTGNALLRSERAGADWIFYIKRR